MRFRLAVFAIAVLTACASSAVAEASSGAGAGPMTASETGSRYGSGITYSMTGPLVVGSDAYTGAFSLSEGWAPTGGITATIQGSDGGHNLSGPCSTSTGAPVEGSGTFSCAVDLDGNQASVSISFSAAQTSGPTETGPNEFTSTYAGTYTAD